MSAPSVLVHANGYREAEWNGARLIVRPDGAHSWANVKDDSEAYAALSEAIFTAATRSET